MKRIAGLVAASACLPLALASGCSAILSASDYHVPEGVDATTPDANQPDTFVGTDSGPGPDTSTPTDAGTDAPRDTGGDTSTLHCGQGLPPLVDGGAFHQLVRACVLQAGCDPLLVSWTVSDCITRDVLHGIPAMNGLAIAQNCDQVVAFTGRNYTTVTDCNGIPDAGGACVTGPNGARVLHCQNGYYQDCVRRGSSACGTYQNGGETQAGCVVEPTCAQVDGTTACGTGNDLYTCYQGKGFGTDCDAITAECNATDKTCYFKGDNCAATASTCSNNTLEACITGNGSPTLYHYPCATSGSNCTSASTTTAYCVSPGCTVADVVTNCKESCGADGKTITVCVGGAPLHLDCTSFGLTGCGMYGTPAQVSCY